MNRVRERYLKDVVPALKKEFGYANVMAIPKVSKVVINMGLGEATSNAKIVDVASDELSRIAGQKATVRRAKKSIAAFKVRGNYTLGLRDQLLFPEIDYMKVDKARGMNVSVVTTAKTDEEARKLLQLMGLPFRSN